MTSPPQALDAALAWLRLTVDTAPDWDEAAAVAGYAQAAALFAGRSTLSGIMSGSGQPLAVISRGSLGHGAQDHPAIIRPER